MSAHRCRPDVACLCSQRGGGEQDSKFDEWAKSVDVIRTVEGIVAQYFRAVDAHEHPPIRQVNWLFRQVRNFGNLQSQITRVRALHCGEFVEDEESNRCFECGDGWPCPTIQILDGSN